MNLRTPMPVAMLMLSAAFTATAANAPKSSGATIITTATLATTTSALPIDPDSLPAPFVRSGRDIYRSFREGLADPNCDAGATTPQWRKQFAHAPRRMAAADDDLLPLFGYVVDELRAAHLPTEFALIPFVESGYRPGAQSASGPAGMWQFIGATARNHRIPITAGYDGRLSPVDSTQAAIRYLKTLHGMFGGDWQLAVMGFNAGEYRILQSMRRAGMNAQNAEPRNLPGLSPITYAYVQKLHALSCILESTEGHEAWLESLDRPVPILAARALPVDARDLGNWADQQGHDPALLGRLNPALAGKTIRPNGPLRMLAPLKPYETAATSLLASAPTLPPAASPDNTAMSTPAQARTHTVNRGESVWAIARRYGLKPQQLLARNHLGAKSVLRPGMVLILEDERAPSLRR